MKKLILLLAITIISCSKPDVQTSSTPTTPVTTVTKYMQVRTQNWVNNTDTGWVDNGQKSFYSNNSADCGKIIPDSSTASQTETVSIRYECRCN